MGKVRTGPVKRISRELLEKYPDLFTTDFQKNKEALKSILNIESKKLRNQIAGYITHLIKVRQKAEAQGERSVEREELIE
ncbi:MAG: 30S ribosomal protein S17e [Sulfolobales archaeon]